MLSSMANPTNRVYHPISSLLETEEGAMTHMVDEFMEWLEQNVPKKWRVDYVDSCGDPPHVNITISVRKRNEA